MVPEELKSILIKACPEAESEDITENTMLDDDLGIDSVRMMMMTVDIEEAFNIKINVFPYVRTVGDLMVFINDSRKKV